MNWKQNWPYMDDIKLGRVQSADNAFADILGELENLDV